MADSTEPRRRWSGTRSLVIAAVVSALVTLGAQGCRVISETGRWHLPAFSVDVVDPTSGQIIDRLAFVVCTGKADALVGQLAANAAIDGNSPQAEGCATMGEKLMVPAGAELVVGVALRDPEGEGSVTAYVPEIGGLLHGS